MDNFMAEYEVIAEPLKDAKGASPCPLLLWAARHAPIVVPAGSARLAARFLRIWNS